MSEYTGCENDDDKTLRRRWVSEEAELVNIITLTAEIPDLRDTSTANVRPAWHLS